MAVARTPSAELFARRAERFLLLDRAHQTITRRIRQDRCQEVDAGYCAECEICRRNERRLRVRKRIQASRSKAKQRLHEAHLRMRKLHRARCGAAGPG